MAQKRTYKQYSKKFKEEVVERFFGNLKHDWLFKVAQPTREYMKQAVAAYIRYYNLDPLRFITCKL